MKRTHTCGDLTQDDIGKEVTLCGWAHTRRDHGGVIFIDLRDRYGITQIVFDPSHHSDTHAKAESIGREWVIQAVGNVRARPEGMSNPKLPTGEIEVIIDHLDILNKSEVPPFEIEDRQDVGEELRLKYRYLDLRRPSMQRNLHIRHLAAQAAREYLSSQQFIEIEMPMLVKTTPGGARVFKAASSKHPGKFFSLPESPQIYKQLLMVAGFDRYFSLAKCIRDEDLRADRQLEFTQIDMEMSFIDEEDIYSIMEGMLKKIFKDAIGVDIQTPFPHIAWHDALSTYGSDKPDLRFGLEFVDVTDIVKHSDFNVFKSAADKGGNVFCLNAKGAGSFSRNDIEELINVAKRHGLPGLAWMKVAGTNVLESNIVKFFQSHIQAQLIDAVNAEEGDLLLFSADAFEKAAEGLGAVRSHLGKKLNLITDDYKFCWVVDWPLYEWDDESGRWSARHHIFTHPKDEDVEKLNDDPRSVRGKMYDVVLNGWELGGGSIRIHRKDLQADVCRVLGLTYDEVEERFAFLLNAFNYGAPPHGGIAIGFDRLCSLLCGIFDIKEVVAFPRNKSHENPLDGSPQEWTDEFLKELRLKLDIVKK